MSPNAREAAAQAAKIISAFTELWPAAFVIYERRRRPLKIGIDRDIAAAAAGAIANGFVSMAEIKSALRFYCGNTGYLRVCREVGAARVDLDGQPAGKITARDAAYAASVLERRALRRVPKNRKAAGEPGRSLAADFGGVESAKRMYAFRAASASAPWSA